MAEGDTAMRGMAPTAAQRRLAMFALASSAWLVSFAVLARLGTWTPFPLAGTALVVAALVFDAVPAALLRPSLGTIGVGLAAGLLMVALTHLAYALVVPLVPEVRAATAGLLALSNAGGFSSEARAGLIVVIASCEEVLFRGALPDSHAMPGRHRFRGLVRADLVQVVTFAAGYALATVTLGSLLLVVCAFSCAIVWGIIRFASGSLVAPIVAHVVWDLGVLVVWPLAASR